MTRVADDVLGKLARQQADVFRRVREGSLPPERVLRMHRQLLGTLIVPFDPARSWEDAVKAGKYNGVYIAPDFNPAIHLPLLAGGLREAEVTLRKQDEITTTAQWLKLLDGGKGSGQRFAHPLVVLGIGEAEPDEQREAPIFTVWQDAGGRLWSLILRGGSTYRHLHVDHDQPDTGWTFHHQAAAVIK